MKFRLVVLCLIAAVPPAAPQDVGMGRRQGSGARYEAPYTLEVKTPHVKWADPLPGGPIRVLAVPTVSEGRTLAEIAQRLSLDLTTVSIDSQFDANKWTMCFGRDYGARAEKGDFSLIYGHLEAELTSAKRFDVILLPVNHGWESLTQASRDAIARRVNEGAGLVLIRPMDKDLGLMMPLDPVPPPSEPYQPVYPGKPEASPWRRIGDHFITRAVPVEAFPFEYLENYRYRAFTNARMLIATGSNSTVLAVREMGKGRIAGFGYRNAGISWYMPWEAQGQVPDLQWEYFYSLLCRTILWAAHREPAAASSFDGPAAVWRLKRTDGTQVRAGKGKPPQWTGLAPGRYFLEQQIPGDWQVTALDFGKAPKIEAVAAEREVIAEGDKVKVSWQAASPARVELVDGLGRVIARGTGSGQAVLQAGRPMTHSGFVRVSIGSTAVRSPVRFAAPSRDWTDYEVIMPWYGPGSYQPWIPALDEQFRRIGLTALASPRRNFKIIASAGLHDVFGVYAYRSAAYTRRKAAYAETGDKKYLTRDVVIQAPGFLDDLRGQLKDRLGSLAPLKPLAYYLADESSLTSYTDAFDVDWAPAALAGFRDWLRKEYPSLDALNAGWGTRFSRWEDVAPMTTGEAQRHGNFAPWADHRTYMEQAFVESLRQARDIVREIDPGARASISGTQIPTAHNGVNWYRINQFMDYLQPYSGGNQDQMHHLFRPGILLTGFTGYGLVGKPLAEQQWRRLFYGHSGASIFWHYTLLNPDLTMSEQGKMLEKVFGRIRSGIGRMFLDSRVHEDGVAIHFSMASIRGAWITDGQIRPKVGNVMGTSKAYADLVRRRDAWVQELEKQGVQFRFLATEQIEAGELGRFKVLILPYSIALSDREARAIEQFAARGGAVYVDEQAGRMDERCRWRKPQLWTAAPKGIERRQPGPVPVTPAFPGQQGLLITVRDFGKSRLVGMLPGDERTISLPPAQGVRYDLLRGGEAAAAINASPEEPALLLEMRSRIARLWFDPAGGIRLADASGAPVDRSVVRVEVFDPGGRLVRHYSGNVTVVGGLAKFTVPFAVSDAAGRWRLKARDVPSGLTAERTLARWLAAK